MSTPHLTPEFLLFEPPDHTQNKIEICKPSNLKLIFRDCFDILVFTTAGPTLQMMPMVWSLNSDLMHGVKLSLN